MKLGVISRSQFVVAIFVHFNAAFFEISFGITTVKILPYSLIAVWLGVDHTGRSYATPDACFLTISGLKSYCS